MLNLFFIACRCLLSRPIINDIAAPAADGRDGGGRDAGNGGANDGILQLLCTFLSFQPTIHPSIHPNIQQTNQPSTQSTLKRTI